MGTDTRAGLPARWYSYRPSLCKRQTTHAILKFVAILKQTERILQTITLITIINIEYYFAFII